MTLISLFSICFLFSSLNLVTSQAPPGKPVISLFPERPIHGNAITILCTSTGGSPVPTVIWYKDDVVFYSISTTQNTVTSNLYTFIVLREYYQSEFKCVAKNSQGEQSTSKKFLDIYVTPSPPVIGGPNGVPENVEYTWTCISANANPAPTFKWFLQGSELTATSVTNPTNADGTVNATATLKYTPTKANHQNTLTCVIFEDKTITGNLTTSMKWDIYYAPDQPVMTGFPDNIGIAGTVETFKCEITEGNPTPSFTWYRGDKQLTIGVSNQVTDGTSTIQYTLQPNDVNVKFNCTATNSQGSKSAENSMSDVYVAPEKPIISGFPEETPVEGDEIVLSCSSKNGNPPPEVLWFRGDDTEPKDKTYQVDGNTKTVSNDYTFNIHHDDKNVLYRCEAKNDVTSISTSQKIPEIYVRPVAPSVGGPKVVYEDKQEIWVCNSTRAYKQQTLFWHLNGIVPETFDPSPSVEVSAKEIYSVYSTLKYSPKPSDDGKTLSCTVEHHKLPTPLVTNIVLTVHAKPTLMITPTTDYVEVGKDYSILCNVTSSLDYNVTWYKTDTNGLLAASVTKYVMDKDTLIILNFQVADDGNYFCNSANLAGFSHSVSNSIKLTAFAYPSKPVITVFPDDAIEGKSITIECLSSGGIPAPDLSWYKDSNKVDGTSTTSAPDTKNEYKFDAVFADREVTFICKANNSFGPVLSTSKKFANVYVTPQTPDIVGPSDVYETNSARWWCNITRVYPAPTITWLLDDHVFTSEVTRTTLDNDDGTLAVHSSITYVPTVNDVGKTLHCEVTHNETLTSKMVDRLNLNVFLLPRAFIHPLTVHAEISRSITVECNVTSVKDFKVRWYNSGQQITDSNIRYSFSKTSMTILKVEAGDAGQYSCSATNVAGPSDMSNNVTVFAYALPGQPVITNFPKTAIEGSDITVTCTSVGGVPSPNMTWYRESIIQDVTWNTVNGITSNEYKFTVSLSHRDAKYLCVTQNTYTDPPLQEDIKFDRVYVTPKDPVIKGESVVYENNTFTWTCITKDGYPEPSIHWRIGTKTLTGIATKETLKEARGTFSVNSSLTYTLTKDDVGKTLYCEVRQAETIDGAINASIPLTVYLIPTVSIETGPDHVQISTSHTFECRTVSKLAATTFWYKGGTSLVAKEGKYVFSTDQLTIVDVSTADEGVYTCSSSNKAGHSVKSNGVQLIAYALAGVPVLTGFPEIVLVGISYNITCKSTGAVPAANVTWYEDSVLADTSWTTSGLTTTNVYEFKATFEDRKVNFTCIAQNAYGAFESTKMLTAVYVTPTPQVLTGPATVYETKTAVWWCNTTVGYPEASLRWRLGDTDLTNQAVKTAITDGAGTIAVYSTLTYKLKEEDYGKILFCDMYHNWTLAAKQTRNITLTVHLRPVAQIVDARTDVEIGQSETVQCRVGSTIDYQVIWYKDDVQVTTDVTKYIFGKDTLTILKVNVTDEGLYKCEASNQAGLSPRSTAVELIAYRFVGEPEIMNFPDTSIEGSKVTLTCQSKGGRPAPKVTWYRNDVVLDGQTSTAQGDSVTATYTFNVHFNDRTARFKCKTENTYKAFSIEEEFDEIYVTPSDPVIDGDRKVYELKPTTLMCNYTRAYPNATITWRLDNTDITSQAQQTYTKNSDNAEIFDSYSKLTFTPLKADVGKTLYCEVSHRTLETKKSASLALTVILIPRIKIDTDNEVHVEITTNYKLTCTVVSTITFYVDWYKDGIKLLDNNNLKYYFEPVSLTIKNVEISDSATYTCIAISEAGTSNTSNAVKLITYTKPIIPTLINFPSSTIEGNEVTLTCTSSVGVPSPSLHWNISETLVDNVFSVSSTGLVTNNYTFTAHFSDKDKLYKCIATNDYGSSTIEARIFSVYVRPAKPDLTGSSVVYESIEVKWICNVTRSEPAPVISWRLEDKDLSMYAVTVSQTNTDKTKSAYSTLTYTPTDKDVGKTVHCDVRHELTQTNLTVSLSPTVYLIPRISIERAESHVKIGTDHIMECKVVSEGLGFTVQWFKGGSTNPLVPDSKKYVIENSKLTILNVQITDATTYTCRAENTAGKSNVSNSQRIIAYAFPGEPQLIGFPSTTIAGNSLTLICSVSGGTPTPTVEWFKDNTLVTNAVVTSSGGVVSSTITFIVSFEDRNSDYKCVAKNDYKTRDVKDKFDNVYVRPNDPTLIIPSKLYESVTDSFWCNSSRSFPESKVTFRLGDTDLTSQATPIVVTNDNGTVTVNSRLDYTPKKEDHDKMLYCEIEHEETLSNKLQASAKLKIHFIPTVEITTTTTDVRIGTTKTLENKVVSDIVYNVIWSFNGNEISIDNSKYKLQDDNLIISNFLVSDNGNYNCVAKNLAGTSPSSNTITLSAFSTPQEMEITGFPATIIEGERVTLNCTCKEGIPPPTVIWYRDDKAIDSNYVATVDGSTSFSYNDYSFDVHHDDKNVKYKCEAVNKFTDPPVVKENSINTIYVTPFSPNLVGEAVVHEDKEYIYVCETTRALPTPTISWKLGDKNIVKGVSQTSNINSDLTVSMRSTLNFVPVKEDNEKVLKCLISHEWTLSKPISFNRTLSVTLKPVVNTDPSSSDVEVGNSVTITCNVVSTLVHNVTWYKQGTTKPLTDQSKYRTDGDKMKILNSKLNDAGNYYCIAQSAAGSSEASSNSQVKTYISPGKPIIIGIPQETKEYSTLEFNCSSSGGNPSPTLNWLRDGVVVDQSKTNQGSSGSVVWKSYAFKVLYKDRKVDYACVADNTFTSLSTKDSITVVYVPPTAPVIFGPSQVVDGETETWSCQILRTYPNPDVSWFLENVQLTGGIKNNYGKAADEDAHSVYSNISYTPKAADNGATLTCKVDHSWTSTELNVTKKLEVYYAPETPVISDFSKIGVNGTQMSAVCTATGGNPKPTVYWYKNNQLVDQEDSPSSDGSAIVNSYRFTVQFVDKNAIFRCEAKNAEFTVNKEISFTDVNVVPTGPVLKAETDLIANREYEFTCEVTNSYPVPTFTWKLDAVVLNTKPGVPSERPDGTFDSKSTLKYTPVGGDNGKEITCEMTHPQTSTARTVNKVITVHVKPTVEIKPASIDVVVDTDAVFLCDVSSTKPHNTTWYKVGSANAIKDDGNKYDIDGDKLTIKNVQESDEGKFYCVSQSVAGTSEQSNNVELEAISASGEPAINNFDLNVKNGTEVTATCTTVGGDPPPKVVWYKDGVIVDDSYSASTDAENVVTTTNTYKFTAVFRDRSSTYSCNASNAVTTQIKNRKFTNVYVPPFDLEFAGPNEVTEKVENTWSCSISKVYPSGTITWTKAGVLLSSGNGVTISGTAQHDKVNDDGTYSMLSKLTFSPVALDNFKYLACKVTHSQTSNVKTEEKNITVFSTFTTPVIEDFPEISTEGNTFTTSCTVRGGYPYPTLSWYGDGLELDKTYQTTKDGEILVTTNTLSISVLRTELNKNYVCKAKSSKYELEANIKFTDIYVKPADITFEGFANDLMENIQYNWTCKTSRVYRQPVIEFTLGSTKLDAKSTIEKTNSADGTFNVVSILEYTPKGDDKGKTLTCTIKHADTSSFPDKSINLVVHVKPKVSVQETDNKVDAGKTQTLQCNVESSLKSYTVHWYKNTGNSITEIKASTKYVIGGGLLVINDLRIADDGNYFCTATSAAGTSENSNMAKITVYTPPTQTKIESSTLDIEESETIEADCTATVNPANNVNYVWYFSGKIIETKSKLKIEEAKKQDNGVYRCVANNSVGSAESTITINVKYKPETSQNNQYRKVTTGSLTTLSCNMVANPAPSGYEWYKENEKLSVTSVKYEFETRGGTTVYKCYAINSVGRSSAITFTIVGEASGGVSLGEQGPSQAEEDGGLTSAAIAAIVLAMLFVILLIITGVYCFVSRPEKKKPKRIEPIDDASEKELPPPFDPHRRFIEQFPPPKPWHTPRRLHIPRDHSGQRLDASTVSRGDITVNYGNRKPHRDLYEHSFRAPGESDGGTLMMDPEFYHGGYPKMRPHTLAPLNASLTYGHEEKLRKKRRKQQKKKVKRRHQPRESGEGMESPQRERKSGGGDSPTEKKILIDDDEVYEKTEVNLGSQFK